MKKVSRVAVYDMDGTIVCSLHRYRTITGADNIERIDLPYWRENEYRAGDDSLLPLAIQYKQDLQDENTYVIIATARVLNSPDRKFIREILGQPDAIISRAANDSRSGGLLKVLGLKKYYQAFQSADWTFYEDNATYMKTVCDYFNIRGVYVPSKQGH
jgi:hypothetical protein